MCPAFATSCGAYAVAICGSHWLCEHVLARFVTAHAPRLVTRGRRADVPQLAQGVVETSRFQRFSRHGLSLRGAATRLFAPNGAICAFYIAPLGTRTSTRLFAPTVLLGRSDICHSAGKEGDACRGLADYEGERAVEDHGVLVIKWAGVHKIA